MITRLPLIGCGLFVWLVAAGCGKSEPVPQKPTDALPKGATAIELKASDGATVFGHRYQSAMAGKKVILCFHQAGSSAWEYADVATRFVKGGWDVLAIDQRSGGDLFGHPNRTATALGGSPSYMDAYQDLEAALAWAKSEGYKTIVACGSSYSASLVLKLAAEHGDVSAVMAFSPGEYFGEKVDVYRWEEAVRVPRFVSYTGDEARDRGLLSADGQEEVAKDKLLRLFTDGVHGASTLITAKNPETCDRCWKDLESWLKLLSPK